jgi:galactokinase
MFTAAGGGGAFVALEADEEFEAFTVAEEFEIDVMNESTIAAAEAPSPENGSNPAIAIAVFEVRHIRDAGERSR